MAKNKKLSSGDLEKIFELVTEDTFFEHDKYILEAAAKYGNEELCTLILNNTTVPIAMALFRVTETGDQDILRIILQKSPNADISGFLDAIEKSLLEGRYELLDIFAEIRPECKPLISYLAAKEGNDDIFFRFDPNNALNKRNIFEIRNSTPKIFGFFYQKDKTILNKDLFVDFCERLNIPSICWALEKPMDVGILEAGLYELLHLTIYEENRSDAEKICSDIYFRLKEQKHEIDLQKKKSIFAGACENGFEELVRDMLETGIDISDDVIFWTAKAERASTLDLLFPHTNEDTIQQAQKRIKEDPSSYDFLQSCLLKWRKDQYEKEIPSGQDTRRGMKM